MAGILNYISSSFFHNPVSPDPTKTQWLQNITYKLTSMTGTFLFFASCLVFVKEMIGDHIHCIAEAAGGGGPVSFILVCGISNDNSGHTHLVFCRYMKFYTI